MFPPAAASFLRGGGAALLCVGEVARRPRWRFSNRDQFWRAVDAVTTNDALATQLSRRIQRKERLLQRIIGESGWRMYVHIEELQVQRTLRWIELVATSVRKHRSPRRKRKSG